MMARRGKQERAHSQARGKRLLSGSLRAIVVATSVVLVLQVSIAGAFRERQPQLALEWVPSDAGARARLAAQLVTNQQSPDAQRAAIDLARDAIERDALTVTALRTLAQADNPSSGAMGTPLALMSQVQRLSRRDQPTQIWFIERYLRQGQPNQAMAHFDIALRSSYQAQGTLFPLVGSVLSEPTLFQALENRLRAGPDWSVPFLSYLASNGNELPQTVQLATEFLDANNPEHLEIIKALLARLTAARDYGLAWNLYSVSDLARREGSPSGALVDGGFEIGAGVAPFAWWFAEEGDLWALPAPAPDGEGRVLQVGASSGRAGEVARQLVRLPPGQYRVSARAGETPEDEFERPELRVVCASKEIDTVLSSMKPEAGLQAQTVEGSFQITGTCPFQWISVHVGGEGPAGGSGIWIDDIRLIRSAR